jgi:hypothetical protein
MGLRRSRRGPETSKRGKNEVKKGGKAVEEIVSSKFSSA